MKRVIAYPACSWGEMHFDKKAAQYEEHAEIQRSVASWCSEWLEPNLHDQRAIEFGAGPGTFTRHITARRCGNLVASDLSPAMLALGAKNVPSARWIRANAWEPPMMKVSRIYSTSLLQWAPDPVRVLAQWQKLLVPGGRLLVSLFVKGSLREFSASYPDFSALSWKSEAWWLCAAEEAGFTVRRWSPWETKLFFPSAALALRAIHNTGACASGSAPVGLLRRSLRRYEELFREGSGVPVSWHALRIEAE